MKQVLNTTSANYYFYHHVYNNNYCFLAKFICQIAEFENLGTPGTHTKCHTHVVEIFHKRVSTDFHTRNHALFSFKSRQVRAKSIQQQSDESMHRRHLPQMHSKVVGHRRCWALPPHQKPNGFASLTRVHWLFKVACTEKRHKHTTQQWR